MTDVLRFLSGKSSLTSSENEERGRGKRKAVKNRRFENMVNNVEEAEDEDEEEEEEEEVSVSFMQESPLRRVRSSPSSSSPISQKSSSSSHSPPVLEPLLKKKRCEKVFEESKGCCRVGKNKKHSCPFDGSEVGFEQLAHTMCTLSREIKKMNTNLFYLRETQNELVKSVEVLRTAQESRADVNMPSLHYPPEGIIEDFPASTMESLQKIERKLMERSFLIRCVTYVASCADKTSEGRTITSIMGKLVTLDVAVNFSWKGVQRKDHKIGLEKKPFKNLLIAKVMIAATKRCWPKSESKQVQLKAATWLAQAQSKLDKMNQPSTPATYNNNNQHRL
ncbi:uncharacterized protein LOC111057098 [Nilaparvata lugens]|uniref:uncharacterized protein LOC111057098 n=1 Tax=Nilaparvata lugens TaxID=108931 RepID=UPI00193E49A8|nr:uncharacterized protein LOC111057098 [Nilaparvata lugens]